MRLRILPRWYHLQHDIAHVLMAASGHAQWAERLHDWIGVQWDASLAKVEARNAVVLRGEGAAVSLTAAALKGLGYTIVSQMHDVVVLGVPLHKQPSSPATREGKGE